MSKFAVGDKVCMGDLTHLVLTVQVVRDDSVVCSYIKDNLLHTVELNPALLEPMPEGHGVNAGDVVIGW